MPFRVVCALIVVASTLALASNTTAAADTPPPHFTLTSPAFKDNGVLPLKYAGGAECGSGSGSRGGNLSPPLRWSNVSAKTKSFAILMIEPDGRRGIGSVHWIAYDIPATRTGMKEGEGDAPRPDITGG